MDATESTRRELVQDLNSHPAERAQLEIDYGQVWDSKTTRCRLRSDWI